MNACTSEKKLHGIIPPVITPLDEDETLDAEGFERLIEFGISAGINGIFVMGSSGEAMCVSDSVWLNAVRNAIRVASNRVPVLCGVIDSSTARAIEKIKKVEQEGAEYVVVTPTFYIQNTCQDEIIRHFEKVCASTPLKVVAYNIPGLTHSNIQPDTFLKISKIENLVGIKDSSANWEQFQRILFYLENTDIAVFNGAEELCAAAMVFGADGCVPGLANFFPKLFIGICEAAAVKDIERAYTLQKQVWRIRQCLFVGKSWVSAMKYIGKKMGFGEGFVTSPIEPLTSEEKYKIDKILEEYKEK